MDVRGQGRPHKCGQGCGQRRTHRDTLVWHIAMLKKGSTRTRARQYSVRTYARRSKTKASRDRRLAHGASFQSYKGAFRRRIKHVHDSPSGLASGREMVDTVSLWHVTYVMTSCSLALVTATTSFGICLHPRKQVFDLQRASTASCCCFGPYLLWN